MDTVIVQAVNGQEYYCVFDSQVWTDRVEMIDAAWAEIATGGVFITRDGTAARFNLANVVAVVVPQS